MKQIAAILIASILSLTVVPTAKAQNAVPVALVQAIETQLVMPSGAESLDRYDRYYAFDQLHGREVVIGVFLLRKASGTTTRAGASAVADVPNAFAIPRQKLPVIVDGGCSVVTIYFDIATQRLLSVNREGADTEPELGVCNGRA